MPAPTIRTGAAPRSSAGAGQVATSGSRNIACKPRRTSSLGPKIEAAAPSTSGLNWSQTGAPAKAVRASHAKMPAHSPEISRLTCPKIGVSVMPE